MVKLSLLVDSGATMLTVQWLLIVMTLLKYGILFVITEKAESGIEADGGPLLPKFLIHTAQWIKNKEKSVQKKGHNFHKNLLTNKQSRDIIQTQKPKNGLYLTFFEFFIHKIGIFCAFSSKTRTRKARRTL